MVGFPKYSHLYIALCMGGSKTFAGQYILYYYTTRITSRYFPETRAISSGKVAFSQPLIKLLIYPSISRVRITAVKDFILYIVDLVTVT